jgi:hypothetical protein
MNLLKTCLALITCSTAIASKPTTYVVGSLFGQAGNNFFQIAAACATAWDHEAEAYFPDLAIIPTLYHHYFSRCNIDPPSDEISFDWDGPIDYSDIPYQPYMKLHGYLQSWKYFDHHKERLQKLFAPIDRDKRYIQRKYGTLLNESITVGIQLRYYKEEAPSFPQYGKEYLEKAMALFPDTALFLVSTNTLSFAKQEVPTKGKHVIFLENEPHYIDFYTLTCCKHLIISNSTFGWWAAYLNPHPNKVVVAPRIWMFHLLPDQELALNHPDLYPQEFPDIHPPDWIQIAAPPIF